ncbi:DoxX family protein [Devosia rhodophyticola]|uniref:DoxX family protein n=1 Tax=Devosia rhodophyticola TaxID=3026423 RepID=A0ABY7YYG8_9HYPH|nr:DoxX family protein [Devosia rhodophyticola]WDR05934.1 DoxX family protein [Devosia rhodophyticola]
MFDRVSKYSPQVLCALRVVVALLFVMHGTQKLLGFPATEMQPPLMSLFGLAGIIEIVTGLMMLVGFYTRPAAFVASGTMAVAYFMIHAPMSLYPANNGGEVVIFFCFVFFYLVFAGPGAWSVNRK